MTMLDAARITKANLPTGWRWVRLGEVCDIKGGKRLPVGTRFADHRTEYPYIRVIDFNNGSVDTENLQYISDFVHEQISQYLISKDDVFISIAGSIGIVGVIPDSLDGANLTENAAKLVILNRETLNRDYLVAALNSENGIEAIRQRTNMVGQPKLALERIATIPIPLPPMAEQQRIATMLREQMAAVDKARSAAQARLEAVKAMPAAYLCKLFPKPGQPLPSGWRWVMLGDIALRGPDNGVFKRRNDFGSGVPIVNVSDLYRTLHVDLSIAERVRLTRDELKQYEIIPGDLFFCRSSLKREGIGWCCLVSEVKEPAVFECHVMRVRLVQKDAIPEYVALYWQHPTVRENIIGNSRTATMTTMNQQDLARVKIPLATLPEQLRITGLIETQMAAVSKARMAAEEELQTINALPSALLRRTFNGEM
jgi:type I restriction enzyme, S subunit